MQKPSNEYGCRKAAIMYALELIPEGEFQLEDLQEYIPEGLSEPLLLSIRSSGLASTIKENPGVEMVTGRRGHYVKTSSFKLAPVGAPTRDWLRWFRDGGKGPSAYEKKCAEEDIVISDIPISDLLALIKQSVREAIEEAQPKKKKSWWRI